MREDVEIVLKKLIMKYSTDLCHNRIRLMGLLLDLCSESEREVRILIKVLDTGIIFPILDGTKKEIDENIYTELVNKLHNDFKIKKMPSGL